jgi:hypothetical protein
MTGYDSKRQMAANKLWDRPSVAFDEWLNNDHDESTNPFRLDSGAYWAWAGWKAALTQPAQEPVAVHQFRLMYSADWHDGYPDPKDGHGPYETRTLYAASPKHTWVGLTDDEIYTEGGKHEKFAKNGGEWFDRDSFAHAIEAKLKEKNNGT